MEINPGTLSLAKKKKIWKLVSCSPRKMLLPFRSPLTHVLSPSRPSNFQVGPLSSIFLIHSLILLRLVSHNKLNHPPLPPPSSLRNSDPFSYPPAFPRTLLSASPSFILSLYYTLSPVFLTHSLPTTNAPPKTHTCTYAGVHIFSDAHTEPHI